MFDGNCLIRRAGVTSDGKAFVDLSSEDGTWDWNWFISAPEQTREVLAVALAAITSNKKVFCHIDDPAVGWSVVTGFGILK